MRTSFFSLLWMGGFLVLAGCSGGSPGGGPRPGEEGGGAGGATSTATGGTTATGGMVLEPNDPDDPETNPCLGDDPPDSCELRPSGPACGDGVLNQEGEECDDGNSVPGDGCTGICRVEPNWECPRAGEPCTSLIRCGNGVIEAGEVCDDGNTTDDDGCNATCDVLHASFICPEPGEPCQRVEFCGDGRIKGGESCEDGNTLSGDGCDAECNKEEGFRCQIPGQPCTPIEICGDGRLSVTNSEACDDGNVVGADGCSADCKFIEAGFLCPTPGEACQNLNVCGNGIVTGAETCDDANEDDDDGCKDCQVQVGYDCPFAGAKCIPLCGDGLLLLSEVCDDGNRDPGDGCSPDCRWEDGFACSGEPGSYTCHTTTCGDGIVEGTEGCDDANDVLGDGCTPDCVLEPVCTGGECTSACGDGLVVGVDETCDDGNAAGGDGCSANCQIEPGYECNQAPLADSMTVPIVYRDFRAGGDFEPTDAMGEHSAVTGLISATLDSEGKPVFVGDPGEGYITSADSFAQWYRDVPGTNSATYSALVLWDDGSGRYVNRYGEDGSPWQRVSNPQEHWCGSVGDEVDGEPCTYLYGAYCEDHWEEMLDCVEVDGAWYGVFLEELYDGNPVFFPVDADPFTPDSERGSALIPNAYDGSWSPEPGEPLHNFHFTSEVRYWFEFVAGNTYVLDFIGDDDVWVFINDRLAVDIGGIHTPVNGEIVIAADGSGDVTITQSESATAPPVNLSVELGLQDGHVYEIVVFQAERKKDASSYKLTLSGFNGSESACGPICGDAELSPGEQCDDGVNAGGYGVCQPGCVRGAYCGDGITQTAEDIEGANEQCDDGTNMSSYGSDGCAPGCIVPPRCGDGMVQGTFGETCDDGVNDGTYGGCTDICLHAPFCGDGATDTDFGEQCDDGVNDGSYGNCAPGCVAGPRCGDEIIQTEFGEQCDDGNQEPGDGCNQICREEGVCGDGSVDAAGGEECDDGVNDGGYGECAPGCVLGPRCGDNVVQEQEQCDGGDDATGAYGECAPGCVFGPRCGDGRLQPAYEECDDGNNTDGDECSGACRVEIRSPA